MKGHCWNCGTVMKINESYVEIVDGVQTRVCGNCRKASKINIDGIDYDLKKIEHRSMIIQILKEKMKGCGQDYIEVIGDFRLHL